MRIVLFGATGMVGQGVMRECLLDPDVAELLVVGRSATGQTHPKLREIIHKDFFDFSAIAPQLAGVDACFFPLGTTSAGKNEADYERVTYGIAMAAARVLAAANPDMTFVYVSGRGTDSTEKGRVMWARVKGKTENALLRTFRHAYMFRPGIIQPVHGARSKTKLYRAFYVAAAPIFLLARSMTAGKIVTTETMGRAMLRVAKEGGASRVVESAEIVAMGA